MEHFALLDFDGFVCKAFFAAKARGNLGEAWNILYRLYNAATQKAAAYFDVNATKLNIRLFMSGHTWKKDVFEDYKKSREKDPDLSEFRDEVIDMLWIAKSEHLEADDLINLCVEHIEMSGEDDYIVFSDDKDLHAIAKRYCKINLAEQVVYNEEPRNMVYAQMLAGDKEDDVAGLSKVGIKTALKLLGDEACIEKVAAIYNDKGSTLHNAYKQILLIKPLSINMNAFPLSGIYSAGQILNSNYVDEEVLNDCIKGELRFVKEVLEQEYQEELI